VKLPLPAPDGNAIHLSTFSVACLDDPAAMDAAGAASPDNCDEEAIAIKGRAGAGEQPCAESPLPARINNE